MPIRVLPLGVQCSAGVFVMYVYIHLGKLTYFCCALLRSVRLQSVSEFHSVMCGMVVH